jgi:drug/metabolite transporter (DMT)-like permease
MKRGEARAATLAAAVLFSTGGAAIKVAAFSAAQVSALRSGIAAVALLGWLGRRIAWSPWALGLGVIYAGVLTTFVVATKLTTAAAAIFLQSTAPLYILLLGPLLLREPVTRRDVAYLAAAAAGLIFCFAGQPPATTTALNPGRGNLVAVLCSVLWAFTLVGLRYAGRVSHDASHGDLGLSAVVAGNAIASIGALPWALPLPDATPGEWATVIYLGVFQVGVAYVFLTGAMKRLPALEVSLLLLLEPLLNPMWTWIVRGEQPGVWVIAGGVIIIGATGVKSAWDARDARRLSSSTSSTPRT